MKKNIFSLLLALFMILLAFPLTVSAANEPTTFVTSYDEKTALSFTITGSEVTVSGCIPVEGLEQIWLRATTSSTLDESSKIITKSSGESFTETLKIASGNYIPVQVFIKTNYSGGNFISYIYNMVDIAKGQSGFYFKLSSVYDNNVKYLSEWLNPAECLIPDDVTTMTAFEAQYFISYDRLLAVHTSKEAYENELKSTINTIKKLGDSIIGNETDTYEKIRKLSNWVSENVYYDNDFIYGRSATLYYYPLDVIREKRSICDGFCRLLNALLRSEGIPSTINTTYSLNIGNVNSFDGLKHDANHAIVSAYCDGRWIILDPTWDSGNVYEFGQFTKIPMVASYFDSTVEKISATHQFITHTHSEPENTPSTWAQHEISKALKNSLVPASLQKNYRNTITREQFCTLVMNMLVKYTSSKDINDLLAKSGKTADSGMFTDTNDASVLAAAALNIVNGTGEGKFSPNGTLTREQAATMLTRAAQFLGIQSGGEGITFADNSSVSSWAADGVKFISSLVSSENSNVMGGVGDNKFSPKGSYTIEQSILTVYRLFMCK